MQKYKQIKVNLLPDDYQIIKEHSKEKEISMAEYIRKSLNISIQNPPNRNININHKKVIYHLLKIGININQIAKALNIKDTTQLDKKLYEDIHLCKIYLHNLSTSLH